MFPPLQALAFDSWEHKRLGDLAFHLAKQIYGCDRSGDPHRNADCERLGEEFADPVATAAHASTVPPGGTAPCVEDASPEFGCKDRRKPSYGDIVMCVDYFLTPEKMLSGAQHQLVRPYGSGSPADEEVSLQGNSLQALPIHVDSLQLDVPKSCMDSLLRGDFDQASHGNHAHFQGEVVVSQRIYHALALSIRADEENLTGAMILSAISDHYLGDFSAPGHITTFRSHSTDVLANALHDRMNQQGLRFSISIEELNNLRARILQSCAANPPQDPGANDTEDASRRCTFDLATLNTLPAEKERGDLKEYWMFGSSSCVEGRDASEKCVSTVQPADHTGSVDVLRQWVLHGPSPAVDGDQGDLAEGNRELTFLGDARLWRTSQLSQRAWMLLLEINGILDVLESQRKPPLHNSLRAALWSARFAETEPKAWTSEPAYEIKASIGSLLPVQGLASGYDFETYRDAGAPPVNPAAQRIEQPGPDAVVGLSASSDAMYFGRSETRNAVAATWYPWGRAKLTGGNWDLAWATSIEKFAEGGGQGYGAVIRPVAMFPQLEIMVSLPVSYLSHPLEGTGHRWAGSYGIRIDSGFSSFLTFFLKASRDQAGQADGRLASGLSLGAGVELSWPVCRTYSIHRWPWIGQGLCP